MFRESKVGDRVWDFEKGWGRIIKIDTNSIHPLAVKFNECDITLYTFDGKSFVTNINPSLFWDEIKYEIPKKPFDLKVEFEKLEVVDFKEAIYNHYICYELHDNTWKSFLSNTFICPSDLYFINNDNFKNFIKLLNEHKITPEELRPLMLKRLREVYGE